MYAFIVFTTTRRFKAEYFEMCEKLLVRNTTSFRFYPSLREFVMGFNCHNSSHFLASSLYYYIF